MTLLRFFSWLNICFETQQAHDVQNLDLERSLKMKMTTFVLFLHDSTQKELDESETSETKTAVVENNEVGSRTREDTARQPTVCPF